MLRKEYEILQVFAERPWQKQTFKQVQTLSGKRSKSYVYNTLKRLVGEGILKEDAAGNVTLYSLNIESLKAQTYTGIVAEHTAWSRKHIPHTDLERAITKRIPTSFFTLLVTGSYAKNRQKTGSDIDAVILCDDTFEPKKIYAELKHYCEINVPPIHLHVFRKREFLEMILDSEANFGKETARNNLVLFGGGTYYRMIFEAMKNGFTG